MRSVVSPAIAMFVLAAAAHAQTPSPQNLVAKFQGHFVAAAANMPPDRSKADEVRVLLVDSEYWNNGNAHKMTHIPVIEFDAAALSNPTNLCTDKVGHCNKAPCWLNETPDYMRREGGVDWCGWYIHETGVTFDTSASPLTLEKFKRMLTPETAQNVDLDALAKLGPDLWDSANSVLVNSRVVLTNGTLAVTGFKPDVQSGGTTVAEVATVLTWTTTASEVRLSPLTGNTEQDLLVSLTKPTQVWVRNFSARPPHDPTQALHFPELFDFAAGAKPPWPERAIPKIAPGPNAQNSFCPPVVLGK